MRKIIVSKKDRDLKAIAKRVLGDPSSSGLEALKQLNPHLQGDAVAAGMVLLLPELPGLRASESTSIGGEAFDGFAAQVLAALDVSAQRVRAVHVARRAEQKELGALLESAPLKRAFEADPELRAQAAAAAQVFKQDQGHAKEAEETLAALQAMAGTELAALGKLLG
jgi:hypothetical protein